MKNSKLNNLFIDTTTSTPSTEEVKEMAYMNLIFQEIDSSNERELMNIIKEIGADIIPLLLKNHSEKHLLRIQSMDIDLEQMHNIHRLFSYVIHQLKKEETCEERMHTLFLLTSVCKINSNKSLIASYPAMLESFNVANPTGNEILFITQILKELSKNYDSKYLMGQMLPILRLLQRFFVKSRNSGGDHNTHIGKYSCLNVLETLKHLSLVSENQTTILTFRGGKLFEKIIVTAQDIKQPQFSSLALQCINSLVSRCTIEKLLQCKTLLETLHRIATTCPLEDLSIKAAQTFERMALFIRPGNDIPAEFIEYVISFVSDEDIATQNPAVRVIGFACLKKLASTNENRLVLAKTKSFMWFVCDALASDDLDLQSFGTTILHEISYHNLAARVLAKSGVLIGRLMSIAIQTENKNCLSMRRQAMKTILTMVNDDKAAVSIIQKDILTDLAVYVAGSNDDDDEVKRCSLKTVIRLTPWL